MVDLKIFFYNTKTHKKFGNEKKTRKMKGRERAHASKREM